MTTPVRRRAGHARLFDDEGHLTLVRQLDRILGDLREISGL